ncbi:phage major capsid protein [Streptomyces sp. NPDC002758]
MIQTLRARRENWWNEARALLDAAEVETRDLSAAEDTKYKALMHDIDTIDARIKDLADQEQRTADSDAAFRTLLDEPATGPGGKGKRSWVPSLHEFREMQHEQRAIGTTGAFIPQGAANVFFDMLRNRTAVLAAGPTILKVDHAGSIKVPSITSAVTVSALAENSAITPADPGLGSITLDPKKLAALTLIAREALEDSNPDLQGVVGNSLIRDLAVELDRQMITGDGTGNNMRGLRNVAGVTAGPTTGTNGASLSGAPGFGFLADTLAAYEAANADPSTAAFFMHARTWASVRKLVDSQNRPIVSTDPTQGVRNTLWGIPVRITNNLSVAETQGTSTDCSSIILADMSQIVVAQSRDVELVYSADYAFNTDQIAARVTARFDIGVPQPKAVVLTTGVRP